MYKLFTLGSLGSRSRLGPTPRAFLSQPQDSQLLFLLKADCNHLSQFLKTKPVSVASSLPHLDPAHIHSFPTDLGEKVDEILESSGMCRDVLGSISV